MSEIKQTISSSNGFKGFERIQNIKILKKPFEVGDELNNMYKLKRHVVNDKYKNDIASLFPE